LVVVLKLPWWLGRCGVATLPERGEGHALRGAAAAVFSAQPPHSGHRRL